MLDPAGKAPPALAIAPGGLPAPAAGLRVGFVAVTFDAANAVSGVSPPVAIDLIP
jgi:hypothetical protein